MRESRVIALAGVLQACALVRQIATEGRADAAVVESSLASVFRIDAASAADVFGGLPGLRMGLETLIVTLDDSKRDAGLVRLAMAVLRLERRAARRNGVMRSLSEGIAGAQRQVDHLGLGHATVQSRLADIYAETLSPITPRIVVHGNPHHLADARKVEQIRALLLAAIRAAVLWRQMGGSQLRLLFRRGEYAMLARGLLARATLDHG